MTVAFGNLVVIIIAEAKIFEDQVLIMQSVTLIVAACIQVCTVIDVITAPLKKLKIYGTI